MALQWAHLVDSSGQRRGEGNERKIDSTTQPQDIQGGEEAGSRVRMSRPGLVRAAKSREKWFQGRRGGGRRQWRLSLILAMEVTLVRELSLRRGGGGQTAEPGRKEEVRKWGPSVKRFFK